MIRSREYSREYSPKALYNTQAVGAASGYAYPYTTKNSNKYVFHFIYYNYEENNECGGVVVI